MNDNFILEDIDNLLNTGDIPDLFTESEKAKLLQVSVSSVIICALIMVHTILFNFQFVALIISMEIHDLRKKLVSTLFLLSVLPPRVFCATDLGFYVTQFVIQ